MWFFDKVWSYFVSITSRGSYLFMDKELELETWRWNVVLLETIVKDGDSLWNAMSGHSSWLWWWMFMGEQVSLEEMIDLIRFGVTIVKNESYDREESKSLQRVLREYPAIAWVVRIQLEHDSMGAKRDARRLLRDSARKEDWWHMTNWEQVTRTLVMGFLSRMGSSC